MSKEYIISDDTGAVTNSLFGMENIDANKRFIGRVFDSIRQAIPPNVVPILLDENETTKWIDDKVRSLLDDTNSCVITPDRFMLSSFTPEQVKRLGMVRTAAGGRVPRQGYPALADQINGLSEWVDGRNVTIVDDGVFTGGTAKAVIEACRQAGVTNITQLLGIVGNGDQDMIEGIPLTVMKQAKDLYDWVDARDLWVVGGKNARRGKGGRAATSVPYSSPFSDGSGASLNMSPDLLNISEKLLEAQSVLIQEYDPAIRMRDVIAKKFPFPNTVAGSIPVGRDTRVVDYIDTCRSMIGREQKRGVAVCDMDGTLYQLPGGFGGSELETKILQNYIEYLRSRGDGNPEQAIAKAMQCKEGASTYLSKMLSMSRADILNIGWDVRPEGIIELDPAIIKLQTLQKGSFGDPRVKRILLTSAPSIWQRRVTEYLGLTDVFETIYTAEQFSRKEEIFTMLAGRYDTTRMVSIGDQQDSDLDPLIARGGRGIKVNSPEDTVNALFTFE